MVSARHAGMESITVIGSFVSPFVRKVLACLNLKGLDYRIDPIAPFFGDEEFTRLNPKRQVPVLLAGDEVVCGSADICAWLEKRAPAPALMPATPELREQALEWQAHADARLGELFVFGLFQQLILNPFVWGRPRDEARLAELREREIPVELDALEASLPAQGFLFGALGLADIALGAFFRTAQLVRFETDPTRWPNAAAYVDRVLAHRAFTPLRAWEDLSMRTPYTRHRVALAAAGAPLTDQTLGTATPQPPPPR